MAPGRQRGLLSAILLSIVLVGHTQEVEELGNQESSNDCAVGAWGEFSVCSADCGGGTHSRSRSVISEPTGAGAACPELSEAAQCNSQACPVNCIVSGWGNF